MYDLEMFDDEETSEMCSDHHSSFLQGNMQFVYTIIYSNMSIKKYIIFLQKSEDTKI